MFKLCMFLSIFLLARVAPVAALETDNYITWQLQLQDSSDLVNQYINSQIQEELNEQVKRKKNISCEKLTLNIAERFRTQPPVTHPLEDWLHEHLDETMIYPKSGEQYRTKSIYRQLYRFYLRYVKLAPNVQINGVYLGTDKLSHFVSTGRRYFEHYNKLIKKNVSPELALQDTIRFGLKNERTFLGTWSSGVFSYADMEANYQGLIFYQKFCHSDYPFLAQDQQGVWYQQNQVNIRDYVNPYWDETFNPSWRVPKNWKKTAPTIKKLYCQERQSPLVTARFELYQQWQHQSYSLNYITQLQVQGHKLAPDPLLQQSFEKLCAQ
jgi:hypothetical protein